MHIPKTIINKLIPFFSKGTSSPSIKILKKAKASIDLQAYKGYLEVVSNINWARVWTNKLEEDDFFIEISHFAIEQENLEEIGYRNSLQEAALGFEESEFDDDCGDDELNPNTERMKDLAKIADELPLFENPYGSGNQLLSISVNLYELKKIVDLAISVAEASQIQCPTLTLQFLTDSSPIYWKLNDSPFYDNYSSYTADGILMPLKIPS